MKVQNMKNSKGNIVKNQFIIEGDDGSLTFQSYNTVIAMKKEGKIYLDPLNWDYSVSTGKYRNIFLHETKKETERKIKEKIYILKVLN